MTYYFKYNKFDNSAIKVANYMVMIIIILEKII